MIVGAGALTLPRPGLWLPRQAPFSLLVGPRRALLRRPRVVAAAGAPNTHSLSLVAASSQYASIADASSTNLKITGDITLECWVQPASTPSGLWYLISKWNGITNKKQYALVYGDVSGTKKLEFLHSADGSTTQTNAVNQSLTAGTWYHVAVVYTSSTGVAEFFVNGTSIGTSTLGGANSNLGAAVVVGANENPASYFDGLIDEVRIWNVVRTSTQINNNQQVDVTGQANLQAYWKLNNAYTDSSGNAYTLTPSGSPTFSTTVPFANYL